MDLSPAPQKPTVRKYDGSGWSTVGAARFTSNSSTLWQEALYVNNGTPYLALLDDTSTATQVYEFSSTWTQLGADVYGSLSWYANIKFHNNVPYVMYQNIGYGNNVEYMPSTTWGAFGSGAISAGTASQNTMQIASDGTVYVAYGDYTIGKKLRVKSSNGRAWSDIGTSSGISIEEPAYASIRIDSSNNIYVAYSECGDSNRPYVKKYNGISWEDCGINPISTSDTLYQSMYLHNGIPFVAFVDTTNGSRVVATKYE